MLLTTQAFKVSNISGTVNCTNNDYLNRVSDTYREIGNFCDSSFDNIPDSQKVARIIKIYDNNYRIEFDAGIANITELPFAETMLDKATILHKICKGRWTFYFHFGESIFHFEDKEDYIKGLLAIGEKCI